ncbi:pyrethroid hydrolase Ces2a-like [Montipora foliosa]|uniref:pyrethroid hydrolase Ces2a-like n=1 Tax=Montipora foliosa TaxID=591990 RepID=UPI0035F12352
MIGVKSLLMVLAGAIVVGRSSFAVAIPSERPIVETKYGKIVGKTRNFVDEASGGGGGIIKNVNAFLGIPYASPPVNNLRFRPPKSPDAWKPKIYNATSFRNVCAQYHAPYFEKSTRLVWPEYAWNKHSSEDCLYLNVFTPRRNARNASEIYPVIMFIHGGGYVFGTTTRHTTPGEVLPRFGVVLVTIQYRLGPFGFMTTGDEAAKGNWGMLDQVHALKWIQENIKAFGGDPNKVTILGVSSGGASVGLHMLSPLSKGLFHQAIMESGVELSPFAFRTVQEAVKKTKTTAKELGCVTENHPEMMECLRAKDTNEILKHYPWQFVGPVIDNFFIYDTPENLRRSGKFHSVPLIGGFNSNEGAHNTPQTFYPPTEITPQVFKEFIEEFVKTFHQDDTTATLIEDAIEFQYTPWSKKRDSLTLREMIVDIQSDYYVSAPTLEVLGFHSQKAATFMYEFSHRSKWNTAEEWKGVQHGDNTPYDFGAPFLNITSLNFTDEDKNVSRLIMSLYANFAKKGVPTTSSLNGVTWTEFNKTHGLYLTIQGKPEMRANFNPRRMAFWNSYYPRLVNFLKNMPDQMKTLENSSQLNSGNEISAPGSLGVVVTGVLFLQAAV